jgi:hypothetical protein
MKNYMVRSGSSGVKGSVRALIARRQSIPGVVSLLGVHPSHTAFPRIVIPRSGVAHRDEQRGIYAVSTHDPPPRHPEERSDEESAAVRVGRTLLSARYPVLVPLTGAPVNPILVEWGFSEHTNSRAPRPCPSFFEGQGGEFLNLLSSRGDSRLGCPAELSSAAMWRGAIARERFVSGRGFSRAVKDTVPTNRPGGPGLALFETWDSAAKHACTKVRWTEYSSRAYKLGDLRGGHSASYGP